jgi:hypothetical protein
MALSGQKTVAAAGTAVVLGTDECNCGVMVKALSTNSGLIFIGNDGAGDVASTNGLQLAAAAYVIFERVGNLGNIWIDSAVNGEGVCWLKLDA